LPRIFCLAARNSLINDRIFRKVFYVFKNKEYFFVLNINEYTQMKYYFSAPEQELPEVIKNGGDIFIDIGANVGFFSVPASFVFEKVFSFEPTPHTFQFLCNNIDNNKIKNIQPVQKALSNAKGVMTLYENPFNQGGNSLEPFPEGYAESKNGNTAKIHEVEVTSLDSFFEQYDFSGKKIAMKVDIEGHELPFLEGAYSFLSKYRPSVFLEVSLTKHGLNDIRKRLPDGFAIFLNNRELTNESVIKQDSADIVIKHKE
ncbi:MAG: FkbM family methyltransferase, partial [Deferribacterales bacterium]